MPPDTSRSDGAPRWWLIGICTLCALTQPALAISTAAGAHIPNEDLLWWTSTLVTLAGLLGLITFAGLAQALSALASRWSGGTPRQP